MRRNRLILYCAIGALIVIVGGFLLASGGEQTPKPHPTTTTTTVAPTTTTTTTPPPTTTIPPTTTTTPWDTVTPNQRAQWERVSQCEEGGNWSFEGATYSGGLGITRANWAAYNVYGFPADAALASEDQQIMVAERIQFNPPDQSGICRAW